MPQPGMHVLNTGTVSSHWFLKGHLLYLRSPKYCVFLCLCPSSAWQLPRPSPSSPAPILPRLPGQLTFHLLATPGIIPGSSLL